MNGRTIFRAIAVVLLLVVVAGIGVTVYNAGLAAGFNQAAQQAVQTGQPVPVGYPYGPYGHGGWGFGFGFFGILLWIIGILLIFGLIRAAFGWGRGGWTRRDYGPGGWNGGDRVAELHRELHRREETAGQSTRESGGPDSSQSRSTSF